MAGNGTVDEWFTETIKEPAEDFLSELKSNECKKLAAVVGIAVLVPAAGVTAASLSSVGAAVGLGVVVGLALEWLASKLTTDASRKHAKRFMPKSTLRDIHNSLNAIVPISEGETRALVAVAINSGVAPTRPSDVAVAELKKTLEASRAA